MIIFKEIKEFSTIDEVYAYHDKLKQALEEAKKEIDTIESEVLKLAQQNNITEGKVKFLSAYFSITTKSTYKITNETQAFPFLKTHCKGLVKETANYQSLQSNIKKLNTNNETLIANGISLIPSTTVKII